MRRHVVEIRPPGFVPANAFAVILDAQEVNAVFLAADQSDIPGPRIDAVLDKLGYRLERIALRQGNNANRVPVVADAQSSCICSFQPLINGESAAWNQAWNPLMPSHQIGFIGQA